MFAQKKKGDHTMKNIRKQIHSMIDLVTDDYLDALYWTVQQFAAKGMNEQAEKLKQKK